MTNRKFSETDSVFTQCDIPKLSATAKGKISRTNACAGHVNMVARDSA